MLIVCCINVDNSNIEYYILIEDLEMANVNVRIDAETKRNAEAIFAKLGITPTTAINIFYNQVIRTNSIPFELKVDLPNETTVKALEELETMENHPEKYKRYDTVDDLMEDLFR